MCIEKKHTASPVSDNYPGHYDEAVQYTSGCSTAGWWLSLGRELSLILGSGEASFFWSHLTPRGLGGRTSKSRGPACPITCALGEQKRKWMLGAAALKARCAGRHLLRASSTSEMVWDSKYKAQEDPAPFSSSRWLVNILNNIKNVTLPW